MHDYDQEISMKITNIRLGFATNSSSSHSIIILPSNDHTYSDTNEGFDFGWQNFVCSEPDSKLRYLVAQMYNGLFREIEDSEDKNFGLCELDLKRLIFECTGIEVDGYKDGILAMDGGYNPISVDHQSAMNFKYWNMDEETRKSFFSDFAEFMRNDRVVVFGGNDNGYDYEYKEMPQGSKDLEFYKETIDCPEEYKLRRNDGKNYVLFNKRSGAKIRFSFNDEVNEKATTPELVDVKITNKCYAGCEYCYQASGPKGRHASYESLKEIFTSLSKLNVFEVALGGGEPTLHPNFTEMLYFIRNECDITPNFSTYSTEWLADKELVEAVRKNVGGIGVSVHSKYELDKVRQIAATLIGIPKRIGKIVYNAYNCDANWQDRGQKMLVMAQHVLGTAEIDETQDLIRDCWEEGIPLLLLGYKTKGFGKMFKPYPMDDLGLVMNLMFKGKKVGYGRYTSMISVDTQIVNEMKPLLDDLGIHPILYASPEGSFSCYINAVTGTMGPSSYCDNKEMIQINEISPEIFKEIFGTF